MCERQAKEARIHKIQEDPCCQIYSEAVDPVEVALQDMAERMDRLQQDSDRRCRAMQEAVDRAKAPPIELVHKPVSPQSLDSEMVLLYTCSCTSQVQPSCAQQSEGRGQPCCGRVSATDSWCTGSC